MYCFDKIHRTSLHSLEVLRSGFFWVIVRLWPSVSSCINRFAEWIAFQNPPNVSILKTQQSSPPADPDRASFNIRGMDYKPHVLAVLHHSTNAVVARLEPGVVLKYARYAWWEHPEIDKVKEVKLAFEVEVEILKVLGDHRRIIPFLGTFEPQGLRFAEAEFGSLQSFIDQHFEDISLEDKMRWRLQATEAIAYIHEKGVIHSDLRPDNFLLYATTQGLKAIRLCDFGGSVYGSLNGGHLPDAGFFDPRKAWVATEQTDIFSLGSVFYTIMEGHWPYMARVQMTTDEYERYIRDVDLLFRQSQFPVVDHLDGGAIIRGCWCDQYERAVEILKDHGRLVREV